MTPLVTLHAAAAPLMLHEMIDHINRDRLDNRRSNLRRATRRQQVGNVGIKANNTSGFRGVFRGKASWYAQIGIQGVSRNLGSYATAEEAAHAYDAAAREQFGEFAFLNFPEVAA